MKPSKGFNAPSMCRTYLREDQNQHKNEDDLKQRLYNSIRKILGINISDQELMQSMKKLSARSQRENMIRHVRPAHQESLRRIQDLDLIKETYRNLNTELTDEQASIVRDELLDKFLPGWLDDRFDSLGFFWAMDLLPAWYSTKERMAKVLDIDLSRYPPLESA
ncbi:MAG: hypothetical protein WC663_02265 [Patescibacteria group bacterium]